MGIGIIFAVAIQLVTTLVGVVIRIVGAVLELYWSSASD
jgi:hypothetical protein